MATSEYPQQILIVKTSSLGDIIQAFVVLEELRCRFPRAAIDWAAEESLSSIPAAHPLIRTSIPIDLRLLKTGLRRFSTWSKLGKQIRDLRKVSYDLVFDLQGNTKSGLVTFLARGKTKVGFGFRSAREWPNLLATRVRFNIAKNLNIRHQYLALVTKYFGGVAADEGCGICFKMSEEERRRVEALLGRPEWGTSTKVMVCPGSKWVNKQLRVETLIELLKRMEAELGCSYLFIWGNEGERAVCQHLQSHFASRSWVLGQLSIPAWQNLMNEVDLVVAVDSSALHLCATSSTASFSVFGPTSPEVFKPMGERHFAFQGTCPYGRTFEKQCPILRSCATGGCIRGVEAEEVFAAFISWWRRENFFYHREHRAHRE